MAGRSRSDRGAWKRVWGCGGVRDNRQLVITHIPGVQGAMPRAGPTGPRFEIDRSDRSAYAYIRPFMGTVPRCPTRGKPGRMRRRREFRLVHLSRWLGLAFVAGGFAALGRAWVGPARESCVDCQLPYLGSGGIGGIALVVLGVGLLIVAQIRTERVRLSELFDNPRAEADASPEADAGPGPDRRSVPASRGG